MDFLAVRLTMSRVASREGVAENVPEESPLRTEEKRRLSRTARVYDAARVAVAFRRRSEPALRSRMGVVRQRSESLQWTGTPPHPPPRL